MRELRFDGLSPDGAKLILVGKDGQRWSVTIDERIEAAVRRDRARLSRVEIDRAGVLRPREIQARIRAGATAEDVAAASGLPVEHVRRFEGPVLTERAWVAHQAQSTEVRRPEGDVELGDLVVERLQQEGVDPADLTWDAWRRDDGQWVVIATFPVGPNTLVATWTYDSSSRTMTAADDNARALSAAPGAVPLRLNAPARPTLTSVGRIQAAVVEPATSQEDGDLDGDAEVVALGTAREDVVVDLTDEQELEDAVAGVGDDPDDAQDADGAQGSDGTVDNSDAEADTGASAGPDADDDAGDATPAPAADTLAEGTRGPADEGAGDVPLFEAEVTGRQLPRTAGRPPVPSFDEILFGPSPGK